MKLMMTIAPQDECFPVTSCHHTLPERFSLSYIFQFSDVVDLKWPFRPLTILALLPVESFDDFGEAQCPNIPVELDIELCIVRRWFSEVFQAKDLDVACLLLPFDSELESVLRFESFDNFVDARFVLVRQSLQKTRLLDPFELVQGLLHPCCQSVIVCQASKLSVVGKNDFGISEVHPLRFVRRLASRIDSVSFLGTELLHFVLGDM